MQQSLTTSQYSFSIMFNLLHIKSPLIYFFRYGWDKVIKVSHFDIFLSSFHSKPILFLNIALHFVSKKRILPNITFIDYLWTHFCICCIVVLSSLTRSNSRLVSVIEKQPDFSRMSTTFWRHSASLRDDSSLCKSTKSGIGIWCPFFSFFVLGLLLELRKLKLIIRFTWLYSNTEYRKGWMQWNQIENCKKKYEVEGGKNLNAIQQLE